jgi:hypothetical protein
MRAAQVLHQLLAPCWDVLDARLVRRLLGAVEALVASRQLVLMELARQFPGALRVAAPLKALDRLLSNPRVQRLRAALYATALAGFWPVTRAVVVVDWCTLTRDESLHLLRAALPVGGRTLPVWDEVHPQAKLGNAKVHLQFLATLRRLLPIETVPILITDAGFGVPWFRDAQSLGFACIGRLRGRIQLRPVGQTDWAPVCAFGELGVGRVIDLGLCEVSRRHAHRARVVVYKNPPQDRKHRDAKGRPVRGGRSRAQAQAAREPWVLVVSPALGHSLTRVAARMEVLLLLHALASVAAWLRAVIGRRDRDHERLLAHGQAKRRQRPTLSLWRIGWELLKRGWPPARPWTEPPDAPPLRLEVLG